MNAMMIEINQNADVTRRVAHARHVQGRQERAANVPRVVRGVAKVLRGVLGFLPLALVAGALPAQAPPACADSVSRFLEPLVGVWDVRTVFRVGERWDTTAATARIERDFQGCLLREVLEGERSGAPYHVLNLWGAVGLHEPIQRTFVHSQHGLLSVYSGRAGPDGLVLRDSLIVRGQLVLLEHRFQPFVSDSMRFTSRRSTDRGGTWVTTWFADYLRRAP